MRTPSPWQDPRTSIWYLRKRIPAHLRAVSGRSGDTIKISTGTADRAAAMRAWPDVLRRYADLEAGWARAANVVELTPGRAGELAAGWAAWIAGDFARLDRAGETASLFGSDLGSTITAELESAPGRNASRVERRVQRLQAHALEAARLADISVAANSLGVLMDALGPAVEAAYREAGIREAGILRGDGARWHPLAGARSRLPAVPDVLSTSRADEVSLRAMFNGWSATTTVKGNTIASARYVLEQLIRHIGHDDALRITRADLAGWRDALLADGRTNTTWNNRLSLVRQVFEWGTTEGRLPANVADAKLRLRKSKAAVRLPYSDAETVRILEAARRETRPSLRWAPWIMAFSGMRVAEVLQLDVADVREDGGIWHMAVHEDDPGKSVKTGQRRSVPLHAAIVREGFLAYLRGLANKAGPVFPDKGLDPHGNRGGRAWNVTGLWVREKVGITQKEKAPNHSFRHRMEDELRAAEVPEDVRDAILGHARKTTGRTYGVRGEALRRLAEHINRVPVPAGLFPEG